MEKINDVDKLREYFTIVLKRACLGITSQSDFILPFYELVKKAPTLISDDDNLELLVSGLPTKPFHEGEAITSWKKLVRAMATFVVHQIEVGNAPWEMLRYACVCAEILLSKEEKQQMIANIQDEMTNKGIDIIQAKTDSSETIILINNSDSENKRQRH